MCALAPDIGALRAACSAFLHECRCLLCGSPWRKASTFPCGHTFCYDCAIDTLEGPGISQSECPTCKLKFWKKELRINSTMNSVVEHAQRILSVAGAAAAGRGSDSLRAAADEDQGGSGAESRGGAGTGDARMVGHPTDEGALRRAEQADAWTGAESQAAALGAADAEVCDVGPCRLPSPRPVGDSGLRHALPNGNDAVAGPLQPYHAHILRQPAYAHPSGPEAAPMLQGPACPAVAAPAGGHGEAPGQRGASARPLLAAHARAHAVEAPLPRGEAQRPEEPGVAVLDAAERLGGPSTGTVCELGPERTGPAVVALDACRLAPAPAAIGPVAWQGRDGMKGQVSRFAMPSAVAYAAAAAGLPYTPTALRPLGADRACAGAGGPAQNAGEVFLSGLHEGGRHGDIPPGARSVLPQALRPAGGASATPFGIAGRGGAEFGSYPLGVVASGPTIATPHEQLLPQPRSQAGAGWATLSNGRPAGGPGGGRQRPGSVVSIRRGTPSVNNAYLDFHALLEQPVHWRPVGHSALGVFDGSGDGWGDCQEAAWLLRLAELPGPTEPEAEALENELGIVNMFLEELRAMMVELQGGSNGVGTAAAMGGMLADGLGVYSANRGFGSEGPLDAGEAGACEAGTGVGGGAPQQQDGAAGAGEGATGNAAADDGAAQAPPSDKLGMEQRPVPELRLPLKQGDQAQQPLKQEPRQPECVDDGRCSAPARPTALCHGAGAGSFGNAVARPEECVAAEGFHHKVTSRGPSDNGGAHTEAPQAKSERQQPASDDASEGLGALQLPPPAGDMAVSCASDAAAVADEQDQDGGLGPRCKRARTEAVGPGPLPPCASEGPTARRSGPRTAAEAEEGAQVAAVAGPPLKPRPGFHAAALAIGGPGHGRRTSTAAAAATAGGNGAAAAACRANAGEGGGVTLPGGPPAPHPPSAARAPSPPACHQGEPKEDEVGAHANTRRRRDKAHVSKRHRSEPPLLPLGPLFLNPPAQAPPAPSQQQQGVPDAPAGGQRQARRAKARERGAAAAAAVPLQGAEMAGAGPAAARRAKPLYVLSTTLSPDDRSRLKELTRRVRGLELLSDVQPQLTHLVVSLNSEGQVMGRTIKYLRAVIQGCWVVGTAWVDACLAAGRLLPEGPFEATGDTVHPGTPAITRLRPERGDPPLFSGLRFCVMYLKGTFDGGITKPELEALLQAAGGTLVRRPVHRAAGGGAGGSGGNAMVTTAATLFGAAAMSDLYDTTTSLATQQLTPQTGQEDKDGGGSPLPPGMPPVLVLVAPEASVDTARIIREWRCAPIRTSWVYDCISRYQVLSPEAFKFGQDPHSSATDTS